MAKEKLIKKCAEGKTIDLGLAHIADTKADYVKTDIDDGGTIDGTEVAAALAVLGTKLNAVIKRLEDAGISLTS